MRARNLIPAAAMWLTALTAWASDFDAANELYDAGRFAEAKAGYEKLVESHAWSANIFYNLGNAAFRAGAPGEAILQYERALTLDPAHPEARANLALVRSKTGAVQWPRSWRDEMFPSHRADWYTIGGAVAGWLAVFLFAGIFVARRAETGGLWFCATAALVLAAYCGAALFHSRNEAARAIITSKSAEVHLAPAESSAQESPIPAGSEVRILSERGDWTYCALPSNGRGWIPAKALARVRLDDV